MMEILNINLAPKDGTIIYGFDYVSKKQGRLSWNGSEWEEVNSSGSLMGIGFYPTHFTQCLEDLIKEIPEPSVELFLKNCPCCGGKAVITHIKGSYYRLEKFYIECSECKMRTQEFPGYFSGHENMKKASEDAFNHVSEIWNKRVN